MIRVRRPKREPKGLASQRRRGLALAFAALNQHGAGSRELGETLTEYHAGRELLFLRQHRKCAYCERQPGLAANPLEHFRPKGEAFRHLPGDKPAVRDLGYWWLTWTWDNHLFACHSCNSGLKRTYFPLAPGATPLAGPAQGYARRRLRPEHTNVALEDARLIDPASRSDDPLDHIAWRPIDQKLPLSRWKWSPSALTPKGYATIRVLRLDLLADDIDAHLRHNVVARAQEIRKAIDAGRHAEAAKAWKALGRDVARPQCVHAGPTWNALHALVDPARRAKAGLADLPRPA